MIGESPFSSSGLFTEVRPGATGTGGNLTIETGRFLIADGAQVSSGTLGSGDAGSLTVRATEVEVIGGSPRGPSILVTGSEATGTGGNLTIDTGRLRVADGAQIAASTAGSGNAGELIVRATESVELIGSNAFGRSGLFANAIVGTGNGGDLTISTDTLTVRDRATISTSNFSSLNPDIPPGQGQAGNLTVQARSLQLDNQGSLTTATASGEGGNINLQVSDLLLMRQNSEISTEAGGTGNGGNIDINTDFLVALEDSDIIANAFKGRGGNIQIAGQGLFLDPFSEITASSELGVDGVVNIQTPDVDPTRGLVTLPEGIVDVTGLIAQGCSAGGELASSEFIVTGRGGLPPNPGGTLSSETVLPDLGTAVVQSGRNVSSTAISTNPTSPSPAQIVEAQGWVVNANGQVVLVASAPTVTLNIPWLPNTTCNNR